ncbi:putative L-ascorbate peroxidase 6 [Vitis vinifera]|uniref:Putative L-ascorbate peroxidase 6 n=1 Tax=Vitis vinifera TaxID=29760 RepID=A0A438F229_VITVI|nr:putative L-ascorbate peroxidase 6 [Vitis vinifera]
MHSCLDSRESEEWSGYGTTRLLFLQWHLSWADMIAVAGAEAVSVCGGPKIPVQLGRLDSMAPDPEGKLPEESLDASALKQCFQRKGLA